jgi:Predicted amidophosphoribosyltransferases
MSVGGALLNLFFPPKCPFCGAVLSRQGICGDCRRMLPWTQETERERTLPGGARCASPLFYEDMVRDGILRFKFSGNAAAAEPLGGLIAECAAERFPGEFDTVSWVPVSARRLRRRGYDQARLLAEAACRRWDTRPRPLLRKVADNPAQSGLEGASARRANVLGVYEAADGVSGRRILLIDDIVTTGSTLGEAVRVLRDAGAAEVVCATAAAARLRPEKPCEGHGKNT